MSSTLLLAAILLALRGFLHAKVYRNDSLIPTFSGYRVGDKIRSYQLIERIDGLGVVKYYEMQHHWTSNRFEPLAITRGTYAAPIDYANESLVPRSEEQGSSSCIGDFCLDDNIFHGGHGDVWRAHKHDIGNRSSVSYVLKRMRVTGRPHIQRAAQREIFFGQLLSNHTAFPTFITHFVLNEDYWLVFKDEGASLQGVLYALDSGWLRPSGIWLRIRTTAALKRIMHQIVSNTAQLHAMGIVHRDIKPSNILLNLDALPRVCTADFSSAMHIGVQDLYGAGPSTDESTLLYAPPEVVLSVDTAEEVPYHAGRPQSYDIWSIGVVFLELLLGTADVFSVDQRSAAMITQRLQQHRLSSKYPAMLRNAILMASLADYCIYKHPIIQGDRKRSDEISAIGLGLHTGGGAEGALTQQCSEKDFAAAILRRDPLGLGFPDRWGIDLLGRLLAFDPLQRINLSDALVHAYFRGPYLSLYDQSEHATASDRDKYDKLLLPTLSKYDQAFPLQLLDEEVASEEDGNVLQNALDEVISNIRFACPACRRSYLGDWAACQRHLATRRHGQQCLYGSDELLVPHISNMSNWQIAASNMHYLSRALPSCLSDHALLPVDPRTGWCDLQGRRAYVEDLHALYLGDGYVFTGVLDGHFGSYAARYSATALHGNLLMLLGGPENTAEGRKEQSSSQLALLSEANPSIDVDMLARLSAPSSTSLCITPCEAQPTACLAISRADVCNGSRISAAWLLHATRLAFLLTDTQLGMQHSNQQAEAANMSDEQRRLLYIGGCTASVVMLLPGRLLLAASIGDSRIIACCHFVATPRPRVEVVQLSVDHTPYRQQEAHRVISQGGFIGESGGVQRVNGRLAVSRSLGDPDPSLAHLLSAEPDVLLLQLPDIHATVGNIATKVVNDESACATLLSLYSSGEVAQEFIPVFLVIGSDGLWDVMTNQQVAELVCLNLIAALHSDQAPPDSAGRYPLDIFQRISKHLAHEALLRGSSDNIGVSVIDLQQ